MKLAMFLTLTLLSLNVLGRPTIQDFTRERDLRTTVLSPNGRYIASIVNKDQTRILVITDLQAPNNPIIGRLNQKSPGLSLYPGRMTSVC